MAREFNGSTSNFLRVGSNVAELDITGSYLTISAWIKVDDLTAPRLIVSKQGDQYDFQVDNADVLELFTTAGGGSFDICTGSEGIRVGQWEYVVGKLDGNKQRIYINGKADVEEPASFAIASTGGFFTIGVSSLAMDGLIADVAIWAAGLTDEEVWRLYRGASPLLIRPGHLRGYWPLDDYGPSGQSKDRSKYNNDVAMTGAVPLNPSTPKPYRDPHPVVSMLKKPGAVVRGGVFSVAAPYIQSCRYAPGSNGLIYNPTPPAELLIGGDYFTAMIWMRPDTLASGAQIMCRSDSGGTYWDCYHQAGHLEGRINNGGFDTVTGTTDLTALTNVGRWHHIVFRKNGSGADSLQLLLNAKLEATVTSTRSLTTNAVSLCIGNRGQTDSPSIGRFSDFAMWAAALTNEEILRIYNGESPLRVRPGSLRGYWPLDDYYQVGGTPGQVRDMSRYNNVMQNWGGGTTWTLVNAMKESRGVPVGSLPVGGESVLGAFTLQENYISG